MVLINIDVLQKPHILIVNRKKKKKKEKKILEVTKVVQTEEQKAQQPKAVVTKTKAELAFAKMQEKRVSFSNNLK